MKLRQSGEPRGNRPLKTRDVLESPREERLIIWDESDGRILQKILKNEPFHSTTFADVLIALKIIFPELVTDEILRVIREQLEDEVKTEIQNWKNGQRLRFHVLTEFRNLLLCFPSSRDAIKDQTEFIEAVEGSWSEVDSPARALGYILLFPETTAEIRRKIADQLLFEINEYEPTGQLPRLAAARLIDPDRFRTEQTSEALQEGFLEVLRSEKQNAREYDDEDPPYPTTLVEVLIVLAQEAHLTSDGLELKFASAPMENKRPLPERSVV